MRLTYVLGLAILALGWPASAALADEVLIAAVGPLKGQYAVLGEQIARGAELAVSDINHEGGVNGERLRLLVEDDNCDPRQALVIAQKLAAQGVKFVDGHYCSAAAMAAAPIYAEAGIVMISPAASYAKFTDEGSWNTNRLAPRDDAQGGFAGRAVAKSFAGKPVAILNDGSPFGQALATSFKEALNAAGESEKLNLTYSPGRNDYEEIVNPLLAADIAVVYIGGAAAEAGSIVRRLRDLASPAQIIGADPLLVDQYWQVAGTAGEGTIASFLKDPLTIIQASPLIDKLRMSGAAVPDGFTLHSYASIQAYAAAAKASQSFDGRAVSTWLRQGQPISTVLGPIAFDTKGDVKNPDFAWYQWRSGNITAIENLLPSGTP